MNSRNRTLLTLAIAGVAMVFTMSVVPTHAAWVSYHDFGETAALGGNITVHTIGTAESTNELNTSPVQLIQFSDGALTDVSVTVANANGTDLRAGNSDAPAVADPANALFNGVGLGFGTGLVFEGGNGGPPGTTFTLGGLDPSKRYDLAFVGGRLVSADNPDPFVLSGVDGTPTNASSSGVVDAFTTLQETRGDPVPGEFIRWTDINPGADGNIVVTMSPEDVGLGGADRNLAYIMAMRLEEVPEPSTLALAAFGLLGLIGFGRRRKR